MFHQMQVIEIEGISFTYTSPGSLIFERFLDVFGSVFKLLDVFSLGVSIELFLAASDCNLVWCWRLLPIFEDAIQLIHRLDVDAEVADKS
jgi:hypothetical protein